MREAGRILVVSCYELGHQPLAAASALGFLERAGYRPAAVDLAVEPLVRLKTGAAPRARLIAVSVPMHTALHIGVRAAATLRRCAPQAHICFYGLYAALNAGHLLERGIADSVIGGEFEEPLVGLARALESGGPTENVAGVRQSERFATPYLARLDFPPPSRGQLPGAERYARLLVKGESRVAAAVETTRGCLHLCRHCPIPPVYAGRFFVIPREVVLADIRELVRRGVRHVTFADPDFLNGPGHSMAIARAMHEEFPHLTFDFTAKVEHLLRRRKLLDELAACGCLFVVSAVESLSDEVLAHLSKGHTRADVFEALDLLRSAGIALRPSLVAFTPWTTIEDYLEVLDWIEREGLVHHIDPVQLSIRLLVPPGSLLLELDALWRHLGPLDPAGFSHSWTHPDPRMDRLHDEVLTIVQKAARREESAAVTLSRIGDAALMAAGRGPRPTRFLPAREVSPPPRITEPWFC